MIDVCNIFKSINNPSGNFLLFSQYTNDLAKSAVDPGYKVRPSRFFCLNLDSSAITNFRNKISEENATASIAIPKYFQNYYENDLSYLRYLKKDDYTPFMASTDFIIKLLEFTQSSSSIAIENYLVYDNKIDL